MSEIDMLKACPRAVHDIPINRDGRLPEIFLRYCTCSLILKSKCRVFFVCKWWMWWREIFGTHVLWEQIIITCHGMWAGLCFSLRCEAYTSFPSGGTWKLSFMMLQWWLWLSDNTALTDMFTCKHVSMLIVGLCVISISSLNQSPAYVPSVHTFVIPPGQVPSNRVVLNAVQSEVLMWGWCARASKKCVRMRVYFSPVLGRASLIGS